MPNVKKTKRWRKVGREGNVKRSMMYHTHGPITYNECIHDILQKCNNKIRKQIICAILTETF